MDVAATRPVDDVGAAGRHLAVAQRLVGVDAEAGALLPGRLAVGAVEHAPSGRGVGRDLAQVHLDEDEAMVLDVDVCCAGGRRVVAEECHVEQERQRDRPRRVVPGRQLVVGEDLAGALLAHLRVRQALLDLVALVGRLLEDVEHC